MLSLYPIQLMISRQVHVFVAFDLLKNREKQNEKEFTAKAKIVAAK